MPVKSVEEQISDKLVARWEQTCQKLQGLAEEVPAELFNYKPVETVRTVAEVLRHIAFWNQYVTDRALGRKADDSANEIPKEKFSTKAQVLSALKESAAEASKALKKNASGLSTEMAETLITFIEHTCEHYGQLAVYARLNGIVPPVSRG